MTAQATTLLHYFEKTFEVLDSRNVTLFDPNILNIECHATSTGNWKGYKCEYAIYDDDLFLINFEMNGSNTNQDLAFLNFLTKENTEYQIKAEINKTNETYISLDLLIRSDHFYYQDINFNIQKSFLIARDRRIPRQHTAARDDMPWYYKDVRLVRVQENRLFSVEDYSTVFYQFLRLFTIDGVLEKKYRATAAEFLTENLGVSFDSYFKIID